ncbi:hypothetical protein [Legionella worsleiensis]|uniref:hypothetical protein n=1 Tax=Legionella worsleiensis TaxID=45076 RepID=UPI0012ECF95E|nr:hypothetical protein [Legionella worsleiensis]
MLLSISTEMVQVCTGTRKSLPTQDLKTSGIEENWDMATASPVKALRTSLEKK